MYIYLCIKFLDFLHIGATFSMSFAQFFVIRLPFLHLIVDFHLHRLGVPTFLVFFLQILQIVFQFVAFLLFFVIFLLKFVIIFFQLFVTRFHRNNSRLDLALEFLYLSIQRVFFLNKVTMFGLQFLLRFTEFSLESWYLFLQSLYFLLILVLLAVILREQILYTFGHINGSFAQFGGELGEFFVIFLGLLDSILFEFPNEFLLIFDFSFQILNGMLLFL